ncbi:MAG: glucokinase [Gammaproteobacteria bacterium]|nr:glucokinase [Gammaproteobacteria bacterium]MDH5309358.1 glucokinase [Gammaproteobacteria bacterium]
MDKQCLLVGDIGGTNARFALADAKAPGFSRERTLRCADYETADAAIHAYLKQVRAPRPTVISLAAAGPIVDRSVRFTNNHWSIGVDDLVREFDTPSVRLLNDFEAIAYSIPFIKSSDCQPIGLPAAENLSGPEFTVGVIGPGTGLGAVGLACRDGRLIPIVGEAGHVGFAPETLVQLDILRVLRERFDRVSAERLVSGPGLENIYWALTRIHGEKRATLTAAEIFERCIDGSDARASEAVHMFFETLGQVAGNLALTLGAADGIYIAGGIARRYPELLINSRFRSGFEAKGRHRSLMERVPTQLVTYAEPGLLGASYCALEMTRHG